MRIQMALALSIGLHLLIFVELQHQSTTFVPTPLPNNRISIDVIEKQESQPSQSARPSQLKHVKVKDLLPETIFNNDDQLSSELIANGSYDKFSQQGALGFMNALGIESYTPMLPYFETIWKKIDAVMGYPEDFVRQRMSGTVNMHVMLDERGVLLDDALEVTGSDPLLESYVTVLVLHALNRPIPKSKWLKEKLKLPILLSFEFIAYSHPGSSKNRDKGSHYKNALIFKRHRYVKPYLVEKIDKFYTTYFPPIIPIPGGFYIDFVLAYKMIQRFKAVPSEDENRIER